MVEDRITDGKRIAQLLASELTGLQEGPLGEVEVVDADPDAMPTTAGTEAYRVQYRKEAVATVFLYPEYAEVRFETAIPTPIEYLEGEGDSEADVQSSDGTDVQSSDGTDVQSTSETTVQITSGGAVKRAVDVIRLVLTEQE